MCHHYSLAVATIYCYQFIEFWQKSLILQGEDKKAQVKGYKGLTKARRTLKLTLAVYVRYNFLMIFLVKIIRILRQLHIDWLLVKFTQTNVFVVSQ